MPIIVLIILGTNLVLGLILYRRERAGAYLLEPGCNTRVRTWCLTPGPQYGFLVTHNEAISIADFFTAHNRKGEVTFRPTCHYAYHPCDDAVLSLHEMFGAGRQQKVHEILEAGVARAQNNKRKTVTPHDL